MRFFIILTSCFIVLACVSAPIQLTPEAEAVGIGKADPADNYELIGPISATDGTGCGGFGRLGNYDNAIKYLKISRDRFQSELATKNLQLIKEIRREDD